MAKKVGFNDVRSKDTAKFLCNKSALQYSVASLTQSGLNIIYNDEKKLLRGDSNHVSFER